MPKDVCCFSLIFDLKMILPSIHECVYQIRALPYHPFFLQIYPPFHPVSYIFSRKKSQVKGKNESTNPNLHLPKPWPEHPACGLNSCRRWIACSANSWNLPPRTGMGMTMTALEVAQLIYLFWDHRIPAGRPKIPTKKSTTCSYSKYTVSYMGSYG